MTRLKEKKLNLFVLETTSNTSYDIKAPKWMGKELEELRELTKEYRKFLKVYK